MTIDERLEVLTSEHEETRRNLNHMTELVRQLIVLSLEHERELNEHPYRVLRKERQLKEFDERIAELERWRDRVKAQ